MIKKNIKNHSFIEKENTLLSPNNFVITSNGITHTGWNIELNNINYIDIQTQQPRRFLLSIQHINGETKRFYVNNQNPVSYSYDNNFLRNWLPLELEVVEALNEPFNPDFFYDWFNREAQTGLFITLEKLDPTGIVLGCQNFHNCFLTEINYEVVFDRPMGNMKVKISFSNMNTIF